MWDVIVIGLGPTGSTVARRLATARLNVLALDRTTFPRRKTCAGGITLRAQKHIPLEFSEYLETEIHSIAIALEQKKLISICQSEPFMYTTRREILDAALVEKARNVGADIKENCMIKTIQHKKDVVHVDISGKIEKARFLVGCDGVNSVVRRTNHFNRLKTIPAWEAEYAMTEHFSESEKTRVLFDIGVVKRGYGWVFPKKKTVSIGVAGKGLNRKGIELGIRNLLSRLSPGSVGKALRQDGHLLPIFNPAQPLSSDGILLAGDAAGLVDPFTGEGLFYAFVSGAQAADWIIQNMEETKPDYSAYKLHLMQVVGRDLLISSRLARLVYSLPQAMYGLASRKPDVLKRYAESLSDASGCGYTSFIKSLPWYWQLLFWDV